RVPSRPVALVGLVAPHSPTAPLPAAEHFEARAPAAVLDDLVLLVGLAAMLALAGAHDVHLAATGIERAGILAAHAEQQQLGHIAKIEADTTTIRLAVLANLLPHDVRDVAETPLMHHL